MKATSDMELAEKLQDGRKKIASQLARVIVGQHEVIEDILITLFARGHGLVVGVPGLAKTLLVSTLAEALDLKFSRIQFTPDLMPSDITGYEILEENSAGGSRQMRFVDGPVFANVVLADEINRTPPKTQSALLQAMQEHKVTSGGLTRPLPLPFLVLATQNPIEQEGTYPLPEAQLDRFFMQVDIGYPSFEEEKRIVSITTGVPPEKLEKILSAAEVSVLQEIVRKVPVPETSLDFAVRLARMTRPKDGAPDAIAKWLTWGAGPRASQALVLAAKARCLLDGRFAVSVDDVRRSALPVLRHRLVLNFQAEAEGLTAEKLVAQILKEA
jgi:MoxR-like ATPase